MTHPASESFQSGQSLPESNWPGTAGPLPSGEGLSYAATTMSAYPTLQGEDSEYRVFSLEDWSHGPDVSEAALNSHVAIRRTEREFPFHLTDLALQLASEAVSLLARPIKMEVRPVMIVGAERILVDCLVDGAVDRESLAEAKNALFDAVLGFSDEAARQLVLDVHRY